MVNYIEQNGTPIPEPEYLTWSAWYRTADRQAVRTEFEGESGYVSTVFLGMYLGFRDPPFLYQTTVFFDGLDCDEYQSWYATREKAEAGHALVVAWVQGELARRKDSHA